MSETAPPLAITVNVQLVLPPALERLIADYLARGLAFKTPASDFAPIIPSAAAVEPEPTPPAPPKAPEPAPEKIGANVWTEARLTLLRSDFTVDGDHLDLLKRINLRPGRQIVSVLAMLIKAKELGLGDAIGASVSHNRAAPVQKFSPERLALLEAEWPNLRTAEQKEALLVRINALPGDPVANVPAMMAKGYACEFHKRPKPAAPPLADPAAPTAPSAAAIAPSSPTAAPAASAEWSLPRRLLLAELWPADVPTETICDRLNKLSGPKLTPNAVIRRAAAANLKRPVKIVPPAAPPLPNIGLIATVDDIKNWFRAAGGNPDAIPTVDRLVVAANQLRAAMNQPRFTVQP